MGYMAYGHHDIMTRAFCQRGRQARFRAGQPGLITWLEQMGKGPGRLEQSQSQVDRAENVDEVEGRDMAGIFKSLFGKKEEVVTTEAAATEEQATQIPGAEPIHVTDETFEEVVLNARVPVMVDFWAPWCGPCRMVAPIVEEMAEKYDGKAVIAKINTDENLQIAGKLGIMGIPTLIVFKDGEEVDRVVGFAQRRALEEKLDAVLD
jgi:thioredoxin 1